MYKKGQFFIVFAIVMIFFIALVTYQYNTAWSTVEIENFEELNENYAHEQNVVVNDAIYSGDSPEDVAEVLQEFGEEYSSYSQEVDPNYGFYQIYYDPNSQKIYLQNFLSNGRTITLSGPTLTGEEVVEFTIPSTSTTSTGTISLDVGGQIIEQSVSAELTDFDEDYNQMQLNIEDLPYIQIGIQGMESTPITISQSYLQASTTYSATMSYNGDAVQVEVSGS